MKIKREKYFFSRVDEVANAWTGGSCYRLLLEIEIFGYRICFWKKSK